VQCLRDRKRGGELNGPRISWVKSATDIETASTDADKVIAAIRSGGKGQIREQIEQVRTSVKSGDKKEAGELKKKLPAVMWSGTFTQRANDKLVQHSGLLGGDIDNLNGDLPGVREKLKASPYLWALFLSPSGNGLKPIFRVPADVSKHAGSFRAVEKHVSELSGKQIDQACKDPARLCFLSYDPELYHNPGAQEIEPLPEPEAPQRISNGEMNLTERQRVAGDLLGEIDWQSETDGLCLCPNQAAHTTGNGKRDCKVWLGNAPSIHCFHNSCRAIVDAVNRELRSRIGKIENNYAASGIAKKNATSGLTGATNGHSSRHYAFTDLTAISAKAVEWIEEPYLARGEMHFLQGQGGSYKGTLAITWAAEFSQRGEHVLLALAEDDLSKKVKPLLMAAQADMAFIHPLTIKSGDNEDGLVLPDDLDQLERAMTEAKAALVVIDPLLSHVSLSVDTYKDQHVKRMLTQIGKVAQRTNTVIVCVHHTKKDTSAGMKMAGMGSVAFYTTARVVLAMAKLSEDEVVLEVVKSNIGPEGVKQLLQSEIVEPVPNIKCPRLTRVGDSPVGVAEALSADRQEKESKALRAARRILDYLEEDREWQGQKELFDRVSEELDMSPNTVRNKGYFGIIGKDSPLVEKQKSGFAKGEGWELRRTAAERPSRLRSVTAFSNPKGYTTQNGYPTPFHEGTLLKKESYSTCITPTDMAFCNPSPGVRENGSGEPAEVGRL
jgi:VirE N-terminal domain/AAA domain